MLSVPRWRTLKGVDMKVLMVASVIAFEVGTFGVANADEALRREATALFGQVKASTAAPSPQVELGRALFWDTRLSADGKTACASCHPARDWGADRRRFSPDARGALTSRHSPTIFNSVSQPMLRWLGDRKNGADQAESSMTGSMGFASKDAGVAKLAELEYMPKFRAAFPQDAQPLSAANYARALASYEATLTTPAPFDRFLAGDDSALTEPQKAGLKTFVSTGCAGCHNGVNLGGTTLQKFGLTKDYWLETGSEKPDPGRFAVTKKEEDRYVFRVPMLRNVAKTAPYFHDGTVERLDRAVRVMASVQLGRTLDDAAVSSIVSFLESLTGDVPSNYAPPGRQPEM
ncbi:MAG: cytochrome-c peroxidase [Candidatus Rokuibacteriota bacterium]|nr:MAG: cytochrome-c peroxidase [Candidatus Rokubacteria bacterium]